MLIQFFCILMCICYVRTQPRRYVILQVEDPATFQTTSAEFTLSQNANRPEVPWNCKSGPNPISYTLNQTMKMRAKSIDIEVGESVECLGLNVSLVVGHTTPVWQGEEVHCPGLMATSQETNVDSYTEFFTFTPANQFQVYDSVPSEECAALKTQSVEQPRIQLRLQGWKLLSCSVQSQQLSLLSCNMTVSVSRDVIAVAEDKSEIGVPGFIWKTDLQVITCSCKCRIRSVQGGNTKHAVVNFTRTNAEESENGIDDNQYSINDINDDNPSFHASQNPAHSTTLSDSTLLIVILALGILLFIVVIMAVFLLMMTRDLKKRLKKSRQNVVSPEDYPFKSHYSLPRHSTAPPGRLEPSLYSKLHCTHTDCRYYTHTSVKLPDFQLNPTYEKPPRALYHQIGYKEESP